MHKTILDIVREATRNVVTFSATPDTNLQAPWHIEQMRYPPTYASAFLYYRGLRIADRQIPVLSFTDFFAMSGIDLGAIKASKINTPGGNSTKTAMPNPADVKDCWANVLAALKWLYAHGREYPLPCGATRPDWRGSFVRLHNNNEDTIAFGKYITKATKGQIEVVLYLGDANENIRDTLLKLILEGKHFVVLATARCRMADDLPKEVMYYIDATKKTNFNAALRQGTAGRAGGHGKMSLVIMSDANATHIAGDNMREGWPHKPPSQHVTMTGGSSLKKVQFRFPINNATPPALLAAVRKVEAAMLAPVIAKHGSVPTNYAYCDLDYDPVKRRNRASLIVRSKQLPALDATFGNLLPTMASEVLRYNPELADVEMLGFNGDMMPDTPPDEKGSVIRTFDANPYSIRDCIKVDNDDDAAKGGHGRAKAWRTKGGMVAQFLWGMGLDASNKVTRTGSMQIVGVVWPVKMAAMQKSDTDVFPKQNTWQAD